MSRRASGTRATGRPVGRAALWCCLGAGFATLLDASVVAYTAPSVTATLGLTTAQVQWFLASFSLTFGLGLAPAGRLGDAYGRRILLVVGLGIFLAGGVVSVAAPDALVLIGGRLLQGLGAGVISAQVLGVIQDVYTGHERMRALAAYTAAGAAAGVAGPLLAGGVLALAPDDTAWRLVLLLPAPFAAATILLALRALPRDGRSRARTDLDLAGIAALGALVVLVTIPVIEPGLPVTTTVAIVVVAVLLALGLAVWERAYARRGRMPLFAPALVRSGGFVAGNVVALLWFGSILALGTVTAVYVLAALGIPAIVIALAMAPGAGARILAARGSAVLYARHGTAVIRAGLIAQTGCLLAAWAATLVVTDPFMLFVVLAALQIPMNVASGVVEPALRVVTLGFAPPALHGVAASFLQLTQRLSATFFVALATGLLLAGGGASSGSFAWAVLVCAAASGAAAGVSFARSLQHPVPGRAAGVGRGRGRGQGQGGGLGLGQESAPGSISCRGA